MRPVFFNNFGYLEKYIPKELFDKLKIECATAEHRRYQPKVNVTEFISGLTGNGVLKHYYVKDNLDELNKFVLDMFLEYDSVFNYIKTLRPLANPAPFISVRPWINIQEKYEFNPNHQHDGVVSFVIWIKIPYDIEKELSVGTHASTFEFTYSSIIGGLLNENLPVSKTWEGKIMMFPSSLQHCVYPFYTSDDVRISISGNISFNNPKE